MARGPNILITGTPGTGKTTTASRIAETLGTKGMTHVELSEYVKENQLYDEWDEEFQCYVINEDKIIDDLEERISGEGNIIIDYHGSDFFPERWFDLVVVLRTDNSVLFDRLQKRGYTQKKVTNNIECEIMGVLWDEACDSYKEEIIWSCQSDSVEEMLETVERVKTWYQEFVAKNSR